MKSLTSDIVQSRLASAQQFVAYRVHTLRFLNTHSPRMIINHRFSLNLVEKKFPVWKKWGGSRTVDSKCSVEGVQEL